MQKAEWKYWAARAEDISGKRKAFAEKYPHAPHHYMIQWDARLKQFVDEADLRPPLDAGTDLSKGGPFYYRYSCART